MATVIRRGAPRPTAADGTAPAAFTLSDMSVQGDEYVSRIRAEAAKLVQQAKAEAQSIRERAKEEGIAAAEQSIGARLNQRVGDEIEKLRPALQQAVAEIEKSRGAWLEHWRESALGLAIAISERIVRRELASNPQISEQWLSESLNLAAGSSEVTVRLAPADHDHLRDHAQTLIETISGLGEAKFVADPAVSAGGCVVETRHGRIDQQLETQLARLAEELD